MSIKETFSNTILLPVISQYDKGAVMQISTMLGDVDILLVAASSELGLFRHLSDYVFGVRNLENKISMTVIFSCKMFKI